MQISHSRPELSFHPMISPTQVPRRRRREQISARKAIINSSIITSNQDLYFTFSPRCHDDVISTRKLTFVLYFADPDEEPWQKKEGGGMEVYREGDHAPAAELLPDFNSALLFGVEPGKSWHAVRE
jgi:hypothetical protein